MNVAYYMYQIPNVESTTRYQHALAIAEQFNAHIISHREVPSPIEDLAEEITVTREGSKLSKVREAIHVASSSENVVTGYHYEGALAGFLLKRRGLTWIVDGVDDPYQYVYNASWPYHRICVPVLTKLLERADAGVYTSHPSTPHAYGSKKYFLPDGAPPVFKGCRKTSKGRRRLVWAGSPRMDRGISILLDALSIRRPDITIDLYGDFDEKGVELTEKLGLDDIVRWRGRVDHSELMNAMIDADGGLCILPRRGDWRYLTAIKCGEYLSTGTVPILSDFPGLRWQARDAGIYIDPDPEPLAEALANFAEISEDQLRDLKRSALEQAEEISWDKLRKDFADIVSSYGA